MLVFLALLVMVGGGTYVFEYNALAKTRGEARNMREAIVKANLDQADLKHVVFETTDLKRLQEVAEKKGMIVEAKPNYVRVGTPRETASVVMGR